MSEVLKLPDRITQIIFDFDGPILDTPQQHYEAFNERVKEFFGIEPDPEMYFKYNGTNWRISLLEFGTQSRVTAFIDSYRDFMEECQIRAEMFSDVEECLEFHGKAKRCRYIASAAPHHLVKAAVVRLNITSRFMMISGWNDYVSTKPDQFNLFAKWHPMGDYEKFMNSTAMVEDSGHMLKELPKYGIMPIGICRYNTPEVFCKQVRDATDNVITSLDQLR